MRLDSSSTGVDLALVSEVEQAEAKLYTAEVIERVKGKPGLRYAPLTPDRDRWVVACNGQLLGYLAPAVPGQVLGGWTATAIDTEQEVGPFHTARAAAANLARHAGRVRLTRT